MANKFHQKESGMKPPKTKRGAKQTAMKVGTANWPGLPGKEGPERANGIEKLDIHPKSEGL